MCTLKNVYRSALLLHNYLSASIAVFYQRPVPANRAGLKCGTTRKAEALFLPRENRTESIVKSEPQRRRCSELPSAFVRYSIRVSGCLRSARLGARRHILHYGDLTSAPRICITQRRRAWSTRADVERLCGLFQAPCIPGTTIPCETYVRLIHPCNKTTTVQACLCGWFTCLRVQLHTNDPQALLAATAAQKQIERGQRENRRGLTSNPQHKQKERRIMLYVMPQRDPWRILTHNALIRLFLRPPSPPTAS